MALNDRYNRGGGRLENTDRYLTELGDRIGNAWAERTGLSRTLLTQGLYLIAAWAALQQGMLFQKPLMLGFAGVCLFSFMGRVPNSRGGLVEQIQVEALGLPRRSFVFLRVWVLAVGLLNLTQAFGGICATLLTGDPLPLQGMEVLYSGCALTGLQVADYIRRTNPSFPSGGHGFRIG